MGSVADAEIQAFSLANHWPRSSAGRTASATPLLARRRGELIEPPSADRITEIVHSALRQAEQSLVGRPQETTALRGRIGEGEPAVETLRVEFPEAHQAPIAPAQEVADAQATAGEAVPWRKRQHLGLRP